jgi:hypothetical protein
MKPDFRNIKVGDVVTRMLGGPPSGIPMELRVSAVEPGIIHCGPWKFSMMTGGEIDDDLGWDGVNTGSYLVPPCSQQS